MTARVAASAVSGPDLGPSWLSGTPDGAVVIYREVTQYTVTAVMDVDGYFSARAKGGRRREYFALTLAGPAPGSGA